MDFNTTKSLKKQTSLKKKDRNLSTNAPQKLSDKIFLEKVLGLTVRCNSHISVHEASNQCAYLAGSVAVILNSQTNKQTHVINTCRKTLSSIDFLHDGSHVATGEAGHQPAVRVWNIDPAVVAENGGFGVQVSELVGHSFGIPVVAFAPFSSLLVSVGNQHDMDINVWNWRTGVKVASNKVSAKVQTISFSEDGKWFVTCGVRHVRFWYIEKTVKNLNVEPLKGKAALLGEKKTLSFCDVATGKGLKSGSCFAISREGILCEFNAKRHLNKWVELRTIASYCLVVGKKYIYCGCADGVIRVFEVLSLDYLSTFPKPHFLGIQISACTDSSHLVEHPEDAKYPDCVAISLDEVNQKLYACYSDHSLYIWDVFNLARIGKFSSFLFHSGPVRDVKVYPDLEVAGPLPSGSFLTCGNDNTLRVWNLYPHSTLTQSPYEPNVYSNELVDVVYIDTEHLIEPQENLKSQQHHASLSNLVGSAVSAISGAGDSASAGDDYRSGLRCMTISDTGSHIAVGDRQGNVRIYDAAMFHRGELVTLEAHDSEVLALEYSPSYVEMPLLATASRDRLLHVLSVDDNYDLLKTLPDHSSSISGVKFLERDNVLHLVSCAADKSLVFRSANCNSSNMQFSRDHIVAEKTTFYDLVVDHDNGLFIAACQDRNIRFYDCYTSKLIRTFKGSESEDGNLSRLAIDPSQKLLATCGSDKSISLIDKQTGDIVATVFGHSESITGLTFTQDSKRLISTCADSCVFVWKLSKQITQQIGAPRPTQTRIETRSVQMSRKGIASKMRGRIHSESQKPFIEDAISLDDDDPELPAWLKKPTNRITGGSCTFGSLCPSTSLSAGLNSEDLLNPRSKWADRASEQLSLATSVTVNLDGDVNTLFPATCDPHEVFAGNLSVQRCHSGSDSNGSSISSATNMAEDKNAQCTLFDLEDVEVSADEEDEANEPINYKTSKPRSPLSGRPSGLDLNRSADKTELPTPTVEELPRPIYLKSATRKDAVGRMINDAGIGDRNDDDGYLVNVSPEVPQLSPDSVDQETSSEEDPEWSSSSYRAADLGSTTQIKSKTGRSDTLIPGSGKIISVPDDELDDEDDLGECGRRVEKDNDEDGDDEDVVGSLSRERQSSQNIGSGRRNSLTSQHLTQMSTQQLLISKKTVADIRKDDVPPNKDFSPEEDVNAAQATALSPKTKSHVEDVADEKHNKSGKFSAFSHSGKMKQPGFSSSKLSANRPPSVSNVETADAHLNSSLKSSRSFREFGQKDSSKGERTSRGAQKNAAGAVSSPVSRDRSLDPETVSITSVATEGASPMLGYQNGTRKKTNKSQHNSTEQNRTGGSVNLKRYKSDTTIARNVMSVSSTSNNVNLSSISRQLGNSSTNLASGATSQPGYAKATRSSNLKTTNQPAAAAPSITKNQRPNGLPSASYLTADSIRKAVTANGDLSEDSLDERSASTNSTKHKKTSKGLSKKFQIVKEKSKLKSWKSADSLANNDNKLTVAYSKSGKGELDFTDKYNSREVDEVHVCSPADSKANAIKSILTPTNPVNIYTNEESGKTFTDSAVTAPCFFCIRKETTMDDDEGFVSNECNRYDRCVCLPEQLTRMRPPKNTDPGLLSDSDLEDSDTRSGSDYFVSQQDLNLAGCQRAVNRLNHTFKVVSGYHQQAECCDEKEEIIQLLTDTCTQIQHSMFARGMVPRGSYHVAADDLQQLRSKLQLASQQGLSTSRNGGVSGDVETSATLNLLQHYSDMLVTLFQRQLATDDASTTVGGSAATLAMGRSSSSFGYNYPGRGGTDNDQANDQDDNENESSVMTEDGGDTTSQEMSHAPSNETLEDV